MKMQSDSESLSARELRPMVATTETATQAETPSPESAEWTRVKAELTAARAECDCLKRVKLEADVAAERRLHQMQSDYGNRMIQLEQDLFAERQINENLSKKLEVQQQSLDEHAKGMRRIKQQLSEPAAALGQLQAEFEHLQQRYQSLESDAAVFLRERDELQSRLQSSQTTERQEQHQVADLTAMLEQTSGELRTLRTGAEENEAARKQLTADLASEREANHLHRKKAEELAGQLHKLQAAADQSEARVRENAAQAQDWEKKAADFKKLVDELTRNHGAAQSAAAQSAQRIHDLEQQLKEAGAKLAAGKMELEKESSARQRLEAENRSLTEANAKAKADLATEREANRLSSQKADEFHTRLQKLQGAADQAEARARESAAQCRDWEKKTAELKKTLDELTQANASAQSAAARSAQRSKEFEEQLKRAGADLAASKTEVEKQNSMRQRLEAENRKLTEANAQAGADLAKEREANKRSGQKVEELNGQFQKLQGAASEAEARARESAARYIDSEKKVADLKKTADELARNHAATQSAAAQSAQRIQELERQLKEAGANLASGKTELEKESSARQRLEAENRNLAETAAKARADLAEAAKHQEPLQKRAGELEQRVREGVSSLARMTAELQGERAERERAEKCASSAAAHLQQLNEKVNRQLELERASRSQITELERTVHDRGDALARASAALRKETKERQMAQKQLRLVSEMGARLEANLASLEEARKTFEVSLNQKEERLQAAERALVTANCEMEKESTERRRLEGLLAEAQRQLEKQSGENKVEFSRLRAALELGELQRKKMEGDLLRSRETATNAQHGQDAVLDSLRRELRQPVEDLRQSACRLLENQVTDEQKRTIETVLEKALFLQVTLNAAAEPDSGSHSPTNARRAGPRDKGDRKNPSK